MSIETIVFLKMSADIDINNDVWCSLGKVST